VNDYLVIESKDLGSLCKRVVEGMDDGYYPLGNITVFEGYVDDPEEVKIDRIFYQSMASYKQ
jgi:hypothetical protein